MGLFDFTVENSTLASRPWKDGVDYWCSFELYPEWKGNTFYVFKGLAYHRRQYQTATGVVVKTFRHVDAAVSDWTLYERACAVAKDLALDFNKHLSKHGSKNTIWFVTPTHVVMDSISDVMPFTRCLLRFKKLFSEDEVVIFEEYLEGEFRTFVTENGSSCEIGSEVLESFCHFTYQHSDGKILLTSLKGTRENDQFRLTCPVIHSTSGRFGTDDRGTVGIQQFFSNHKCTGFCQSFAKPETETKIIEPSAPEYSNCTDNTDSKETFVSDRNENVDKIDFAFVSHPPKYESVDTNRPPSYDSCTQSGLRHRKSSITCAVDE